MSFPNFDQTQGGDSSGYTPPDYSNDLNDFTAPNDNHPDPTANLSGGYENGGGYQDNANTNADYAPTPERKKTDYSSGFDDPTANLSGSGTPDYNSMPQPYSGAPTYTSPLDYNAYEGEPPPYNIKDMEQAASGRAQTFSPEGYGATYVSPPTYNKVELGMGEPIWQQGPTPNSRQRAQPYDIPGMTYEANDRRTVQELNGLTQGMNLEQGQTPSNFVPEVPLDPSQVIDFRNDGTFMGPIESVYNPRNENWNRRYGSDVTGDTTRKYGLTDEGGGAPLDDPTTNLSGGYNPPEYRNRAEINPPNTGETVAQAQQTQGPLSDFFAAQNAGDQQGMDAAAAQYTQTVNDLNQQGAENQYTRFGPGSDYALSGTSQANGQAQQQAQDAYAADLGNMEQAIQNQPTPFSEYNDAMTKGGGTFTTPSGQTVTKQDDGSGYSTWTIPGADDKTNVLYNDNGNWRAVSRQDAAQLQQQGATPDQFTSTTNAPGIAGQAMQSTGTTPQTPGFEQRALQAAVMIGAAPIVAGVGSIAANTLVDAGVPITLAANTGPLIGGSVLLKGTGETVGQTQPFGFALDTIAKIPGANRVTDAIANIPIPEGMQNPLGMIERAAQYFGDDPGHRLNPVYLATDLYKNGLAGTFGQFINQNDNQYAYTSGLQKAGAEYLATSAIQLHDPRNGLENFIKVANPINDYRTIFQDGISKGMTPQQAGEAAFEKTNNGVAQVIRSLDLFNPVMYAVRVPLFEEAVRGIFKLAGVGVRGFIDSGTSGAVGDITSGLLGNTANPRGAFAAASRGIDLFTTLSQTSAVRLAQEQIAKEMFADLGSVGQRNTSLADLYEAFTYGETKPAVQQRRLAEWAATHLGGNEPQAFEKTKAYSERLGNGFIQKAVANGDTPEQAMKDLETFALVLRNADWSATPELRASMDAATRKYGILGGETAAVNDYTAWELAKADIQATLMKQAGLPVIPDRNAATQIMQAGANSLRSLFLLPGATALAAKKIGDEFIRGGLQGVWGLRPADFQLIRNIAGRLEMRGNVVGRTIGNQSVVRQAMAQGIPLDDYLLRNPVARYNLADAFGKSPVDNLGQKVGFGGRVQALVGAPGRAADKYLQTLVTSPTQHLRLSAAGRELGGVPAIVRSFADETMQQAIANYGVPQNYAAAFRDNLMHATNRQDFHAAANLARGAEQQPIVPAAGIARGRPAGASVGTPLARGRHPDPLLQAIQETGGQPGLLRDIAKPPEYTPKQMARSTTATEKVAMDWANGLDRNSAEAARSAVQPGGVDVNIIQTAQRMGIDTPPTKTAGALADEIAAQRPVGVNRGSAGGGTSQPLPTRAESWADAVLNGNGAAMSVPNDVKRSAASIGVTYKTTDTPIAFAQKIRGGPPTDIAAATGGAAPTITDLNAIKAQREALAKTITGPDEQQLRQTAENSIRSYRERANWPPPGSEVDAVLEKLGNLQGIPRRFGQAEPSYAREVLAKLDGTWDKVPLDRNGTPVWTNDPYRSLYEGKGGGAPLDIAAGDGGAGIYRNASRPRGDIIRSSGEPGMGGYTMGSRGQAASLTNAMADVGGAPLGPTSLARALTPEQRAIRAEFYKGLGLSPIATNDEAKGFLVRAKGQGLKLPDPAQMDLATVTDTQQVVKNVRTWAGDAKLKGRLADYEQALGERRVALGDETYTTGRAQDIRAAQKPAALTGELLPAGYRPADLKVYGNEPPPFPEGGVGAAPIYQPKRDVFDPLWDSPEIRAARQQPARPDLTPASGTGPRQTTSLEKGAIDRGMADQIRDTGQYEQWRAGQADRLAPYDPNAPNPSEIYGAGPPTAAEIAGRNQRDAYAYAVGQREQPIPPTGVPRPSDPTMNLSGSNRLPEGLLPSVMAGSDRAQFAGQPWGSNAGILHGAPLGNTTYPRNVPLPTAQGPVDWQGFANYLDQQGAKFAQMQVGRSNAAIERGNKIVGNFREQTPIGEFMTQGTINGKGPGIAMVPFAPFHIHTTQYWANYFLEHPQAAYAVATALNQYHFDEYGGKQIDGRYVSGLLDLSTAAHLMHWAESMYHYAQDVRANPNGNNPLQQAAKIAGMGLFGNNAYVKPFDYLSAPAQGVLQSTTNPLLTGKKDFITGQPIVDKRDQIAEQGSMSPFAGAANLALGAAGLNVPRGIVQDVTNPAQPITNAIRGAAVRGVNALGGNADIKQYTDDIAKAYFLGQFAKDNGLDPRVVQYALYGDGPKTNEQRQLAQTAISAFNRQQDTQAVGKFLPVRVNAESDAKGIFPPTPAGTFPSTNPAPFYYKRDAGEGGTDTGARHPVLDAQGNVVLKDGAPQYYAPEGSDQAGYYTARAQIAKATPVTPESVPFMDYNRDFLQRPDIAGLGSAKADASLAGEIAGNVSRTGAGLPQDQRLARIAQEQDLQQSVGTNPDGTPFTLGDLLKQSGLYDAKGAANKAIKDELSRTNPIAAAYLAKEDAAYRAANPTAQTGFRATLAPNEADAYDAFNDLRGSADYKRLSQLESEQAAAGPYKSAGEAAWYKANGTELNRLKAIRDAAEQSIVDRFGVNPKELANKAAVAAGKSPTYTNTAIGSSATPTATSGTSTGSKTYAPTSSGNRTTSSYGRSGSTGRGGSSAATANQQAGDNFFTFEKSITDKGERAGLFRALDAAGVNPIGQKGVDAQTFKRALDVATRAVIEERLFGRASQQRTTGSAPQGMTRAQAEAAISAIERGGGLPGGSNRPAPISTASSYQGGLPGGSNKAPAGYFIGRDGVVRKSKFAA